MAEVDETSPEPEPETPFQAPETAPDDAPEPDEAEPAEEPAEPVAPEEPPQEGMSEKEIEARFAKLDRENERHAARVGDILAEDAQDLLQCPLCSPFIAGFLLNAPIADEPKAATLSFLGILDASELPQADYLEKCETCEGRGEIRTGSTRPGYDVANCKRCEGTGYRAVGTAVVTNGHMAPDYIAPHDDFAPPPPDDDPRVVALKEAGYTVVPPMQPMQG